MQEVRGEDRKNIFILFFKKGQKTKSGLTGVKLILGRKF